jgi:hypothetical protein
VRKSKAELTDTKVIAMAQPLPKLTEPIFWDDSTVLFSAYGVGWGYCAFALPARAVCEHLGAANESTKQLLLAFELGKRRVLQAVAQKALSNTGERVMLSAADL